MKRAIFAACLLFAVVFSHAQDRGDVISFLEANGVLFVDHRTHYDAAWSLLLLSGAPLEVYYGLLGLGVAVEPDMLHQGASPLVSAIRRNNAEAVEFFLRHGADPHRRQGNGRLPIHAAASGGSARIIEILIESGASPNATETRQGSTPLHEVVRSRSTLDAMDHAERIRVLLAAGADVNAVTDNGLTPLMLAAGSPLASLEEIQVLLDAGANVNAVADNGHGALIAAARNARNPQKISILLDAGADAGLRDNTGRTALDWFDMNQRINKSPVRRELWERTL